MCQDDVVFEQDDPLRLSSPSASIIATIVSENSTATPTVLWTSPSASLSTQTNITGNQASGKKRLAYDSASLTNLFAGKGISWAYNWAATPDGSIVAGAEYVAML